MRTVTNSPTDAKPGDTFTCCETPLPRPMRTEDRTCPECGTVWEHDGVDLGAGARIKSQAGARAVGRPLGPFATSSQALLAMRPDDGSFVGRESRFGLLQEALDEAGAKLGEWDMVVLRWLANLDVQTVAVITAAALIAISPGLSDDAAAARLKARMDRQRRVLGREKPPRVTLVVDESALYRRVGTADVMAAQLHRLLEVAAMPNVVMQVMPEVAHASMASGYLIADDAVWCENVITAGTYTDPETVGAMTLRFDTLRAECYRASESLALIERLKSQWATGVHRPTRRVTGASA